MEPAFTPMGPERAIEFWNETAPKLGGWILGCLQTMGFPQTRRDSIGLEQVSAVGAGEVRRTLLADTSMHQDVIGEVAMQFWSGIRRGKVPFDAHGGWIYTITERTTWRHANARATHLFVMVKSRRLDVSVVDLVASSEDPAESAHRHLLLERLSGLIAELDDVDRRILEAKLEDRYKEVAAELGRTPGSVKVAAHRLCRKLRALLNIDEED